MIVAAKSYSILFGDSLMKTQNKKKIDLRILDPVEIYKLVLTGKIKRFPGGVFSEPDSIEFAIPIIRFLIEDILNWSEDDIKNNLSQSIFKEYHLKGMLARVFNDSPFQAINTVYPDKFKPWEFIRAPQNYWTLENSINAIKWLIEDKLKWTDEDIKEKLNVQIFREYRLKSMLALTFNSSPYQAINTVYPNQFRAWELIQVPENYWTVENAIQAVKWLIEDKLKWTDEEIKEKFCGSIFNKYKLNGLLASVFNNSPYQAFNMAYPNKFKPWEFKKTPASFWTESKAIEALKWLVEKKLKWTEVDVKYKLTRKVFDQYGLGRASIIKNGSLIDLILAAYPGEFTKKELIEARKRH